MTASRSRTCARSTSSTTSPTTTSAPWLDVVRCRKVPAGELIEEQGEPAAGLQLLLNGTARSFLLNGEQPEPVGRQTAPTWMGAIAALTDAPMGVRMVAETDCRMAKIPPDDFVRLALSQPLRAPPGHAPGRARRAADRRDRGQPRAARVAGHDGGRPRARAQQPGRGGAARGGAARRGARRHQRRAAGVRHVRASSASTPSGCWRCTSRRSTARPGAPRSTRSTPPTPRRRCSRRSRISACRSRGRSPSRSPRRASTTRGWRRSRGSPARRRRAR